MKKLSAGVFVSLTMIFLLFPGCGRHTKAKMPAHLEDENTQEEESVTIWIEEIREADQMSLLGYLEKKRMVKNGVSGTRHAYFVYGSDYHEIYEGMIFDTGETYVHTQNGELKQIGFMSINEAVKRILGYEKTATFFRNGRQVFHETP